MMSRAVSAAARNTGRTAQTSATSATKDTVHARHGPPRGVRAVCGLLIFERLDQRPAHDRLRGPERGDECRHEHQRHELEHRDRGKYVREPQAGDIAPHDLEDVVEIDRTERKA